MLFHKKILGKKIAKDESFRGATLLHDNVLFAGTSIPPTTDVCQTLQNTRASPLTAPSAVHLPTRFVPASQPRKLSVTSFFGFISASTV